MSIFDDKNIKPMLLGEIDKPFDSSDYIFELKLDGIRCLMYLDQNETQMRNKRNLNVNNIYPELKDINKNVKERCILDGEIIIMNEGRPDFYNLQRRAHMGNNLKIELAASKYPATFTAFDILYYKDKDISKLKLEERKEILSDIVTENERIAVSRFIPEKGIYLYNAALKLDLEGIVAKKKGSLYYFDKRSKDWLKIKNLKDEDFVICGYIQKEHNIVSLILGLYDENYELVYQGHVTTGVSSEDFKMILKVPEVKHSPFISIQENKGAHFIAPILVCTVKYMMRTAGGGLRQPVFKGIRLDKEAFECRIKKY